MRDFFFKFPVAREVFFGLSFFVDKMMSSESMSGLKYLTVYHELIVGSE